MSEYMLQIVQMLVVDMTFLANLCINYNYVRQSTDAEQVVRIHKFTCSMDHGIWIICVNVFNFDSYLAIRRHIEKFVDFSAVMNSIQAAAITTQMHDSSTSDKWFSTLIGVEIDELADATNLLRPIPIHPSTLVCNDWKIRRLMAPTIFNQFKVTWNWCHEPMTVGFDCYWIYSKCFEWIVALSLCMQSSFRQLYRSSEMNSVLIVSVKKWSLCIFVWRWWMWRDFIENLVKLLLHLTIKWLLLNSCLRLNAYNLRRVEFPQSLCRDRWERCVTSGECVQMCFVSGQRMSPAGMKHKPTKLIRTAFICFTVLVKEEEEWE